jgi:hypothetical protein
MHILYNFIGAERISRARGDKTLIDSLKKDVKEYENNGPEKMC